MARKLTIRRKLVNEAVSQLSSRKKGPPSITFSVAHEYVESIVSLALEYEVYYLNISDLALTRLINEVWKSAASLRASLDDHDIRRARLTKEQFRVLKRMAGGYELFCSGGAFYFRCAGGADWAEYAVRNSTRKALERLGYIEEVIAVGMLFRITNAGRAALGGQEA